MTARAAHCTRSLVIILRKAGQHRQTLLVNPLRPHVFDAVLTLQETKVNGKTASPSAGKWGSSPRNFRKLAS